MEKLTNENKQTKFTSEALQTIENKRQVFWNSYKKHNTLKLVVMVVCLVAIIVAFLVLPTVLPDTKGQSGITIGIAVIALGATYGYSVYVRKKFDKKMKEYFEEYFTCINEFALNHKGFTEVELQKPGKITVEEFNECKLYKDVCEAGSRGLTTFKYNKLEMSIVECAGNVKSGKRIAPVFVGKMVRATAKYKGEKPVIIYLKGNERALPPTNVSEIKNVLEDQKMVVYSDNKDWKKVLSPSVMSAIKSIKTDSILVDLAISIYGGKAFVLMGYDDPLMVLPLQNEFNPGPTEIYKKNISQIVKVVEELNK